MEITLGICELKGGIFHQPIHPIQNLLLSVVPQDTDICYPAFKTLVI